MNNVLIETSTLRIVLFNKSHLHERYINWLNNKNIVRYSELRHRVHTYETCFQYWQSFQGQPHLFCAIEIFQNSEWFHIGNINAFIDEKNKTADIGILVGETAAWGKGYGSKAWQLLCEYLFQQRKIRKISAGTLATNIGMLKIMQKTGMSPDGLRSRHYFCEGKEVDICHYALFNPEVTSVE